MMFGHDDQHHDDGNGVAPLPDDTLTNDAPTALPPADNTAAPALPNEDDAAGDYIMTDTPADATAPHHTAVNPDHDALISIKQQALQALSPLVGHLDQTPEEKFRTTMMLIQAADNDKLIPEAYEAAKAITDEKARAQALLDVVNEINYFTQQSDQ